MAVSNYNGMTLQKFFEEYGQDYPNSYLIRPKESVCAEADRIVGTTRQNEYGEPVKNLTEIGRIWGVVLGTGDVPPAKVAACMIGLKLAREGHKHKRDNLVDLCGYAKMADLCHDGE